MIRTLIFGAIAGYVGKKLYDEGKLTEFKDDLVARYDQAKADIATRTGSTADDAAPVGGVSPRTGLSSAPLVSTGP